MQCRECGAELRHAREAHYPWQGWADESGDSLSYVPTLHDHSPAYNLGTYVDGHWGQYAVARMVEIAHSVGYGETEGPAADLVDIATRHLATMGPSDAPPISDDEWETLEWSADEVTDWLTERLAGGGTSFGWYEGELHLWADVDWEQVY